MDSTEGLLNQAQDEINELADTNADSVNSEVRYMAYGSQLQTALRTTHRYLAYTSDLGEAFRPIAHPLVVTGAYAVSWLYVAGDVSYETYKSHRRGPTDLEASAHLSEHMRLGISALQRASFQGIASMGLPALTIHTVVRQAGKAFKNVKNPRLQAWGPTMTGLAVIPGLPFLFDHPVEHVTDRAFNWIRQQIGTRYTAEKRAIDK